MFNGLAQKIYQQALVNPLGDGWMQRGSHSRTYSGPSYVRAEIFATALTDVLASAPGELAQLKPGIDAITDPQLKLLLQGIYGCSNGDLVLFQQQIAG